MTLDLQDTQGYTGLRVSERTALSFLRTDNLRLAPQKMQRGSGINRPGVEVCYDSSRTFHAAADRAFGRGTLLSTSGTCVTHRAGR